MMKVVSIGIGQTSSGVVGTGVVVGVDGSKKTVQQHYKLPPYELVHRFNLFVCLHVSNKE